jgi:4-diphosphocytidyl-2-C-methyl-D-erythritol kinase
LLIKYLKKKGLLPNNLYIIQAIITHIPISMLCFPNAKINLGLNIIEKRTDGFHNIETVFCPAALTDILEFITEPHMRAGTCTFNATGIPIDGRQDDNLVVRSYHLLSREFDLPAIRVHLHKMIPPGAGLGGGSSDAAFMLKHLDLEFGLKLGHDRLCRYADELGSDCAFFILNRPVFGYERGNRFRELASFPPDLFLVIVHPGIHIQTAEAYAGITPGKPALSLEELIRMPVSLWKDWIRNDFEPVIASRYPVIAEIRDKLYRLGAVYASMSGSGSSVFGLFRKKAPALEDHFQGYFTWTGPL